MHEKYVFLHCSYSAPVRVDDMAVVFVVPARDMFICAPPRVVVATLVRVLLVRGDTDRDVALRDFMFCVVRVLVDAVRDVSVVVRALVRGIVVDMRDCVVAFAFVAVRDIDVPSRTAAPATPMQSSRFATKIRIFFISGKIIANLHFFTQANNEFCLYKNAGFVNFSCCKEFKIDILCQTPADMAELVDALVSGTSGSNTLEVRVFLSAPHLGL